MVAAMVVVEVAVGTLDAIGTLDAAGALDAPGCCRPVRWLVGLHP